MGWELLQHLPYSSDLAPSNFHLSGPPSESLGDISISANKKFNAMSSSQLVEQWEHCSELQGEYAEK